ncbi:hypothetical protein M8J76_008255 [Diaphorina citri]|nr:hypothetical protein M8J76_008255 [Diaphorina citri]
MKILEKSLNPLAWKIKELKCTGCKKSSKRQEKRTHGNRTSQIPPENTIFRASGSVFISFYNGDDSCCGVRHHIVLLKEGRGSKKEVENRQTKRKRMRKDKETRGGEGEGKEEEERKRKKRRGRRGGEGKAKGGGEKKERKGKGKEEGKKKRRRRRRGGQETRKQEEEKARRREKGKRGEEKKEKKKKWVWCKLWYTSKNSIGYKCLSRLHWSFKLSFRHQKHTTPNYTDPLKSS